jgi:hypothetical protein
MELDDVLNRLVEAVPEARPFAEDKYGLSAGEALPVEGTRVELYATLMDLLTVPVLLPELRKGTPDAELVERCFAFCGSIFDLAGEYTRGAVYFQVLEQLLESEEVVRKALPHMSGVIKDRTMVMLRGYAVPGFE